MSRSGNQFTRKASELRRKEGKKPAYDRLLIVCEGKKTEPNYFEELRQRARLPSAHVKVLHSEAGTEPRQVVEYAEQVFKASKAYDKVYAVFDRDEHLSYADAIAMAQARDGKLKNDEGTVVSFEAIVSVPSFELWLLLHYQDIRAWLHRDEALSKVKKEINGYTKGHSGVFAITESKIDDALTRGAKLEETNSRLPGSEAYTDVHDLVRVMRQMRK